MISAFIMSIFALNDRSPIGNVLKNGSLLFLSLATLLPDTLILITTLIWSRIIFTRRLSPSPPTSSTQDAALGNPKTSSRQRTVLVTSTRMGKSLAMCRAMHAAGARVIGADIHQSASIAPTRYSIAVSAHYRLPDPIEDGFEPYASALLQIIELESVDLWIPISDVHSTIEDCMAGKLIHQKHPSCKVFELETDIAKILDDSHQFLSLAGEVWPTMPETHAFTNKEDLGAYLNSMGQSKSDKRFFLKSVADDPVSRAAMTTVPLPSASATQQLLSSIAISKEKPWLIQEFIKGKEYCTHAAVVRNQVRAFVACPSSDLVMHYEALPADSPLLQSFLKFTMEIVEALAHKSRTGEITGQMCFDFIVREKATVKKESPGFEVLPLECNPRTHTAIVLFSDNYGEFAKAYLAILEDGQSNSKENNQPIKPSDSIVYPHLTRNGCYWIGHDIVVNLVLPLVDLVFMRKPSAESIQRFGNFWEHLTTWQDATFDIYDPFPWWSLYHIYLPLLFLDCMWNFKPWSRINISTIRVRKEWE